MFSKRSREGYLRIENRHAPAPAESLNQQGIVAPQHATFESATVTCSHCHGIVVLNPNRTRAREYCSGCDRYICDGCAFVRKQTGECRPLNQLLDQLQEQAARRGE